jgi:hypothetical protein
LEKEQKLVFSAVAELEGWIEAITAKERSVTQRHCPAGQIAWRESLSPGNSCIIVNECLRPYVIAFNGLREILISERGSEPDRRLVFLVHLERKFVFQPLSPTAPSDQLLNSLKCDVRYASRTDVTQPTGPAASIVPGTRTSRHSTNWSSASIRSSKRFTRSVTKSAMASGGPSSARSCASSWMRRSQVRLGPGALPQVPGGVFRAVLPPGALFRSLLP